MKKRLFTSLLITIALAIMFVSRIFTPYLIDAVVGIMAIGAVVEISRVLERIRKYNSAAFGVIIPSALYIGFIYGVLNYKSFTFFLVFTLIILASVLVLVFITTMLNKKATRREMLRNQITDKKEKYAIKKALNTLILAFYPTAFFLSLILINHFANFKIFVGLIKVKEHYFFNLDIFFVLLVFIITVVTDSMAMLIGMLLKGKKLMPRVSPKKTISGAIGGLIGGTLSALLLFVIFNNSEVFTAQAANILSIPKVLLLGFMGAFVCQAGDLLASWLKRKARIKDYGTIFPGHGGVMDRVDGLIMVSMLVFLFSVVFMVSAI